MLAYYPPEVREQLKRFMAAYEAVSPYGSVPAVLRHSDTAVVQNDVGDRTLFDLLHDDPAEGVPLYRAAIDLLVDFQRSAAREINPAFTAGFFASELDMTREYYVDKLMGGEHSERLEPFFRRLAEGLGAVPCRAWVTAGTSAGSAGSSRSMMPLPASPATAELPTCSAGVPGHLVAMSAMSRLATSGACGSAW